MRSLRTKIAFFIAAACLTAVLITTGSDLVNFDYHPWIFLFFVALTTFAFSREGILIGYLTGLGVYLIELAWIGLGVFGLIPIDLREMYQYVFLAGITYGGGLVLFACPILAYGSNKIWRLFT